MNFILYQILHRSVGERVCLHPAFGTQDPWSYLRAVRVQDEDEDKLELEAKARLKVI